MTVEELDWKPLGTAPRDGRIVLLTWMDDGKPQDIVPMKWDAEFENGLFPDIVGMWVMSDASMTWTEHDPTGAPTHWADIPGRN